MSLSIPTIVRAAKLKMRVIYQLILTYLTGFHVTFSHSTTTVPGTHVFTTNAPPQTSYSYPFNFFNTPASLVDYTRSHPLSYLSKTARLRKEKIETSIDQPPTLQYFYTQFQ